MYEVNITYLGTTQYSFLAKFISKFFVNLSWTHLAVLLGLYSVLVSGIVLGLGHVHPVLYMLPGTDFGHVLVIELVHDLHLELVPHVYAVPCENGGQSGKGMVRREPEK